MTSSNTALRAPVLVGPGRVGRSLASAIGGSELRGREDGLDGLEGGTVLLCVPDAAIAAVAAEIGRGPRPSLIGHASGATPLAALGDSGTGGAFSVHPLQTVPDGVTDLRGCPAAVAGTTPEALAAAHAIAKRAGMRPFEVAEGDRVLYHAAASVASNFLVALEQTAAELLGGIAVDAPREVLAPLVRRSLENWIERGPSALTGPIARGDETTVAAHRAALSESRPDLVGFYDALAERTRALASEGCVR